MGMCFLQFVFYMLLVCWFGLFFKKAGAEDVLLNNPTPSSNWGIINNDADALSAFLSCDVSIWFSDLYLHLYFCLAESSIYLYVSVLFPVLRFCVASILGSLEACIFQVNILSQENSKIYFFLGVIVAFLSWLIWKGNS